MSAQIPGLETCPRCGEHEFTVVVEQLVDVEFIMEGGEPSHQVTDGPRGDMEWSDASNVICRGCGHSGPLGKMRAAPENA